MSKNLDIMHSDHAAC